MKRQAGSDPFWPFHIVLFLNILNLFFLDFPPDSFSYHFYNFRLINICNNFHQYFGSYATYIIEKFGSSHFQYLMYNILILDLYIHVTKYIKYLEKGLKVK